MDRDTETRLQRLRDEAAVHIGQSSPAVIQGHGSFLPSAGSSELPSEGWQPVPRPTEGSGTGGADWELLSPSQLSRAGSTPRSLSLVDLHDTGSLSGGDDNSGQPSSASTSLNNVMAAAEAAAASALRSSGSLHASASQEHSVSATGLAEGEAEGGYSSDSSADGPMGLGAALPRGFRLSSAVQDSEAELPGVSAPEDAPTLLLDPAVGDQGELTDKALSEHGSSFANISHPASVQSLEGAGISAPGSPASYQAFHGVEGEEHGMWLLHQGHDDAPGLASSAMPEAAAHLGGSHLDDVSNKPECTSVSDDDISLQATLSPASSAMMVDGEHLADVDGNFTFPSDDDKEPPRASHFPALNELQPSPASPTLPSRSSSSGSTRQQEIGSDDFVASKLAASEAEETPAGIYAGLVGAASMTCNVASGAWRWLQEWAARLSGLVAPQARAAVARAVSAVMRADRTVVLGVGLALVGALYAGAMARNYRLSRALVAKDRDMAQLVTKVFRLQDTLQSSRSIPIVRHTSTTCSFSFAGGGV